MEVGQQEWWEVDAQLASRAQSNQNSIQIGIRGTVQSSIRFPLTT